MSRSCGRVLAGQLGPLCRCATVMRSALATLVERRGGRIAVIGVYLATALLVGIPMYLVMRRHP